MDGTPSFDFDAAAGRPLTPEIAIYRCKRCRKAGRRDAFRFTFHRLSPHRTVDDDGVERGNITPYFVPSVDCPECGTKLYGKVIDGRHSEKMLCGPRCLAAKGPSCECSCAGENHGATWAA